MASTAIDRLDGLSSSTAIKGPCRVATTANITLSGLQTIDGVTLVADDRVLVKNQTDTIDNGIYIASVSGWRRSRDFYGARDVIKGTRVYVNEGTTNANSGWSVTTVNPVVVGTSDITFADITFGSNAILDEDDFASDSATKPPSQQSVKAYSDSKAIANAVSFTPAGNIAAGTVQAAIEELDTEKAALAGATFSGNVRFNSQFAIGRASAVTGGMYFNRDPDNPFLLLSAGSSTSPTTIGQFRGNSSSGVIGIANADGSTYGVAYKGSNDRVGILTTAPEYTLDVNGPIGFTPGSSVTPAQNGDVVFELTNNTTLTIRAKGSDGTVRSATVTLS